MKESSSHRAANKIDIPRLKSIPTFLSKQERRSSRLETWFEREPRSRPMMKREMKLLRSG
jgi:hypothetical protein